jgi:hypothetical protein
MFIFGRDLIKPSPVIKEVIVWGMIKQKSTAVK